MPSPFPGMNPYLEQKDVWEDFHHDFITRARENLAKVVGPHYLVKVEVRLFLHEIPGQVRHVFGQADVGLVDQRVPSGTTTVITGRVTSPTSLLQFPKFELERHTNLEIRDRNNRELVTTIELLSPANKTGQDRVDYLAKRSMVLGCYVSYVEIDLTRGGQRPSPPDLPPSDYYVMVSRWKDWPQVAHWSVGLRDRLPIIPVPLKAPDPDVTLDLQAVLNQVYDAADYGKYIYQGSPEPPLAEAEQNWANQVVPNPQAPR